MSPGGFGNVTPTPPVASVPAATGAPAPGVYRPFTPQQMYLFYGSLTNVQEIATFQFWVLAGDGAPNITAGFVKLNVIDRPQRKGFTVPAGYDPITVDVPIQFESWVTQPAGQSAVPMFDLGGDPGGSVELDIQRLEWMAGRGNLYASIADHTVGAPATGDPPIVTVRSLDGSGNETNLIPPNLHGLEWIVSSIAYGDPLRDSSGDRRRQPATVTLTEFVVSAGSGYDSPTTRAKARNANTGSAYAVVATAAANTISQIVEIYVFNPTWQAKQTVLAYNRPLIGVKSVNQGLPVNTLVMIPYYLLLAPP